MDLLELIKAYYSRFNKLPTEREMIEIRSRMEGSKGTPKINFTPDLPMGIAGQFDRRIPEEVKLNKWTGDYGTLVHELEHQGVNAYQGLMTKGRGFDISLGVNPLNYDSPETRSKVLGGITKLANEGKFPEVFVADNAGNTIQEGFANIADYISQLPMDVDLKDTPFGKYLKEQGIYDQVIKTLEQRRITPSDVEARPKVNPKASYARQALQYLGFKDPFEDTTKD